MDEELQHSQEEKKKEIYIHFIQIYLSRENVPGKGKRYIMRVLIEELENMFKKGLEVF